MIKIINRVSNTKHFGKTQRKQKEQKERKTKERSKESRKRERVERYKEIAYIMPLRRSFKGLYIIYYPRARKVYIKQL